MPLEYNIKKENLETLIILNGYKVIDEKDIEDFKIFFNNKLNEDNKFKLIADLRNIDNASFGAIKSILNYMFFIENKTYDKIIATSVLVNKGIDKIINLLFNIKSPTTPTKVTDNINIACEFINQYS
jgi:hypothetical protein